MLERLDRVLRGIERRLPIQEPLVIAVDTEFQEAHTLTLQTACRLSAIALAVQVYRSSAIPTLPGDFEQHGYLPQGQDRYGRFCQEIHLRPVKLLTPELSLASIVNDLLGQEYLTPASFSQVEHQLAHSRLKNLPANVQLDKFHRWYVPRLQVTLVGHFLPADLGRIFGRNFYDALFRPDRHGQIRVRLTGDRLALIRSQQRLSDCSSDPSSVRQDPVW